MKSIFLLFGFFMYVKADVYSVTVLDITLNNEEYIEIVTSQDIESPTDEVECEGHPMEIRKTIEDSPLYDGMCIYKNGDEVITIQTASFCNNDILSVGGTAVNVIFNALGLQDQQPCPIEPIMGCKQKEFKLTDGNFEGVFSEGVDEVTLEVQIDGLIEAKFTINRDDGPLIIEEEEHPEDDGPTGPPPPRPQEEGGEGGEGDGEGGEGGEEGGEGGEEGGEGGEEGSEGGDEGGEGGGGGEESGEGGEEGGEGENAEKRRKK